MSHHTAEPLRVIVAIAPSGGEIRFLKYEDSPFPSLSFYRNRLTEDEDAAFWKAKLAAEKQGLANWEKAVALLQKAGFEVAVDAAIGVLD